MSSKYSEFRKNKQVNTEHTSFHPLANTNQYNIQQIDNLMQVLITPLNLTKKQSNLSTRNQHKIALSARNSKNSDSKKNSELSQTCDLTTNLDEETISNYGNEKLSPIGKNIARRHYTDEETPMKAQEQRLSGTIRSDYQSMNDQSLLDQIQQKEESKNMQIKQSDRSKIFEKLQLIQVKLSNKAISSAQASILLQKLEKLQMFIDQM